MSVNSKMTALADEIRELSGTTEAMGLDAMATNVGAANDEVDSQTELLAQAVAALEGKAAGGGGGVETCTVTLVGDMMLDASRIVYYTNGSATSQSVVFPSLMDGTVRISVVKNSIIFVVGAHTVSGNITRLDLGANFVTGDATIRSN